MSRRHLLPLVCVAIVCAWPVPSRAQEPPSADPPAHISYVDGSAVLERAGETDDSPSSMPLLAGDRIRTQGGRVEVLFPDGSTLHMDANTVVDVQSDDVVRLLDGRMRLAIAGPPRDVAYRVDAPSAWVEIREPGEYRVSIVGDDRDRQVELAVLRGSAELVNEDGRSVLEAGERAFAAAGAAPSTPYVFNSAAWDAFDRWSEARRDERLGLSAQYLPEDIRPYAGTLDRYGSWRYEQVHGYVWYPRVAVDWRPYYFGRWASLRPYGWTWIASDPWGWPTHHYGRWGFSAGAWFWIPGRHWGPAFVSWGYAPDYISWCPLGWNNRPVLQINIFGGRRFHDPWYGWTVLPRHHFNRRFVSVHHNVLVGSRLDRRVWSSFRLAGSGPELNFPRERGRAANPIRAAGVRRPAIPRGTVTGNDSSFSRGAAIGSPDGRRGFPPAARAPRGSGATLRSPDVRATDGSRGERATGTRPAVPRTRRDGGSSPGPSPAGRGTLQPADPGRNAQPARIAPQNSRSRRSGSGAVSGPAPTSPPSGVRAVPRRENRGGDSRESRPSFSPGAAAQPRVRSNRSSSGVAVRPETRSTRPDARFERPRSEPSFGRAPGVRRAPDFTRVPDANRGSDRQMRSVPRRDMGSAPRFRGPERSAPSRPTMRAPQRAPSSARPGTGAPPASSGGSSGQQARPRGGGDSSQGRPAARRPRG
jgi:hypothetical protein